jgi:hypothetical protein
VAEFAQAAIRDRWGVALMMAGWIHLAFFLLNQTFYSLGGYPDGLFAFLFMVELSTVVGALRWLLGPGWFRSTPMAGIVVRVWATFFILTFNAASMNSLTGWDVDWFKLAWASLSSFGFATMAWLLNLRFLVFAFQMYFTSLLMVRFPGLAYLVYGVSWWLALQIIGYELERRRPRACATVPDEQEAHAMAASGP